MNENHGTGIPGKTYVDAFLKDCAAEIEIFKKSGACTLTYLQKVALQNAYIEVGGHAFNLTCSGACLAEILNRLLENLPKEQQKQQAPPKTAATSRGAKKDPTQGMDMFLLEDMTEVYFRSKKGIMKPGIILYLLIDKELTLLPEGVHILEDPELGENITVDADGKLVGIYLEDNEEEEIEEDGQADEKAAATEVSVITQPNTRISQLETVGFLATPPYIGHPTNKNVSIPIANVLVMTDDEFSKLLTTAKEAMGYTEPDSIELFVATADMVNGVLIDILKDRGVAIPRKATKAQLITIVNELKLSKASVVTK